MKNIRKLIFATILFIISIIPFTVQAETIEKEVTVAYYNAKNYQEGCSDDAKKRGYSYEYLQQIANYTGWKYKYVYGDYYSLYMQFLQGEIDLFPGIPYISAYSDYMYYPEYYMDIARYCIISKSNSTLDQYDMNTFDGKKIGVLDSTPTIAILEDWKNENQAPFESVEYLGLNDMVIALEKGAIDGFVCRDFEIGEYNTYKCISVIYSNRTYLCVSKSSTNVYNQLNEVLNRLVNVKPYLLSDLKSKYSTKLSIAPYFTSEELEYINSHPTLTIGYNDGALPFCDTENGNAVGALPKITNLLLTNLGITEKVNVIYKAYSSIEGAAADLKAGKIDIIYPVPNSNITDVLDIMSTSSLFEVPINLIYTGDYTDSTANKIVLPKGRNQLEETRKQFPNSKIEILETEEDCIKAVLNGTASATILTSLRSGPFIQELDTNHVLNVINMNVTAKFCYGIRKGDSTLLSILDKGINLLDDNLVTNYLYSSIDYSPNYSFLGFISQNILGVVIFFTLIVLTLCLVMVLYVRGVRQAKKETQESVEISEALSHDYPYAFIIDVEEDYVETVKYDGKMFTDHSRERNYDYIKLWDDFYEKYVINETKEDFLFAVSIENVLKETILHPEYSYIFDVNSDGIHTIQAMFVRIYSTGLKKDIIVYGLRRIDDIITKEKAQQALLQNALTVAEQASKAKTSFLNNMSHDIRTPLNAIVGFTDLLDKYQDDEVKRQNYLNKIKDSNSILVSILNNILEMSKIENGNIQLDEQPWSIDQFSDTIYSIFNEMMKEKKIEFKRSINVTHQYAYCDPIKLREVFLNILSNAYKYTKSGGTVSMKIEEISYEDDIAIYRTTISDTGIGISPEFLPHIFEEFTRERNSIKNKIEGSGLGMPIVKKLLEVMGGTITVASELGVGSTFVITMPHKICKKEDLVVHPKTKEAFVSFKGKNILLVEDNDLNAEIAIELLREVGFNVDRAEDGQEAVDIMASAPINKYDVVLMDIQMPRLNGYDATRAIRKLESENSKTPIIAMTANAFEEDKKEAIASGMNGHLGKPIDVHLLMHTLEDILS